MSRKRLAWLLYRQWLWPIQRWWTAWNCPEHVALYTTRVGTMRDIAAGGGRQQVRCGRCSTVVKEF